jgi:hypothetical protein
MNDDGRAAGHGCWPAPGRPLAWPPARACPAVLVVQVSMRPMGRWRNQFKCRGAGAEAPAVRSYAHVAVRRGHQRGRRDGTTGIRCRRLASERIGPRTQLPAGHQVAALESTQSCYLAIPDSLASYCEPSAVAPAWLAPYCVTCASCVWHEEPGASSSSS